MLEEIGSSDPVTGADKENVPSEAFANIPSSTAEVKVRTMRSDLASLAATGGGGVVPQFNKVNVEGLSISKGTSAGIAERKKNNKSVLIFLIVSVALAVLAAVGWLGYNLFFSGGSAGRQQNVSQPNSNSGTAAVETYQSSTAAAIPPVAFVHASLFRQPVDSTVTFSLPHGGAAATANNLQTYDQQVLEMLSNVNKSANFIEIDAKNGDGNDMSIEELLSDSDAEIFDPDFLAAHFNPDATFFAYRDSGGFWPGYVIALRRGENEFSVESSTQAIESSAKIRNIFLATVGAASPSGFADAVLAGTAVRVLNFTGSPSSAGFERGEPSFVYGWVFPGYLVLSTSEDGFAQAVARLQ